MKTLAAIESRPPVTWKDIEEAMPRILQRPEHEPDMLWINCFPVELVSRLTILPCHHTEN